jgi:TP53 regulating kinase and related kinases
MKLIAQGAEGKIYLTDDNKIVKERVKKNYRIEPLDTLLRKTRTRKEAKIISDMKRLGIKAPIIFDTKDFTIEMEFIEGKKLKEILTNENSQRICREIGRCVSIMHKGDMIHGDLTTSNILIKNDEVYFIDFGLSVETKSLEQKAADLLTLYQNFQSVHPNVMAWIYFLEGYKKNDEVLNTFQKMLKRRRYTEEKNQRSC